MDQTFRSERRFWFKTIVLMLLFLAAMGLAGICGGH